MYILDIKNSINMAELVQVFNKELTEEKDKSKRAMKELIKD